MSYIRQILTNGLGSPTIGDLWEQDVAFSNSVDKQKFAFRQITHSRSAWILSTRSWLTKGRYITLFANPSDVQWSMPKRGTVVKTAAGAVRNTWRNRWRNTYFDEMMLNITFQSGNIMPSAGLVDVDTRNDTEVAALASNPQVPPGLLNYYWFMHMVDQPKLLGTWENRHIIVMHSRVFPALRLEGFFTEEPISLSDSASNGNQVTWTASFQVYRTYPKISSATMMSRVYSEFVRDLALNEAIPSSRLRKAEVSNVFAQGLDGGANSSRSSASDSIFNKWPNQDFSRAGGGTQKKPRTIQTPRSTALKR